MPATSAFTEFLSSIALRGRSIIGIGNKTRQEIDSSDIVSLCHKLLSSKGEASGIALSFEILNRYQHLNGDEKTKFFLALYNQFSANPDLIDVAARNYLEDPSIKNMGLLSDATEPTRRKMIIRLNQAPNATQMLIEMRADLLDRLSGNAELREVDRDFSKLFASWFNSGFLQLRKLDWSSPGTVLDNIIRYEAVHGMSGWEDLRKRIAPPDRLIYGFFHPRLRDEPLIFIEVALMMEIPEEISSILDDNLDGIDPQDANTAVFYSISNCQKGLRGVPLGSFLIKQVVEDLKKNFPHLSEYITLSPVPGFAKWLERLANNDHSNLDIKLSGSALTNLKRLLQLGWVGDIEQVQDLMQEMTSAMAWYLTSEKNDSSRPLDPVAKFHLGNGAQLERINWPADVTENGLASSLGAMVNYRYKLNEIELNHERFVETGQVKVSPEVQRLVKKFEKSLDSIKAQDEVVV